MSKGSRRQMGHRGPRGSNQPVIGDLRLLFYKLSVTGGLCRCVCHPSCLVFFLTELCMTETVYLGAVELNLAY